ncbi:hypothetical protein PVAP13_2NG119203 [Panicum virgatum]|uniref:Uncharacterized protein n=1 Tax=Panicum virgatum TaxID=38727 RepID=A0A8T0VIS6_PANVG|nr:hypothetical protein PVAP13_2NG119203 [Panicum virgatum]
MLDDPTTRLPCRHGSPTRGACSRRPPHLHRARGRDWERRERRGALGLLVAVGRRVPARRPRSHESKLGRASLGAGEGSIRSRSREVKLGRAADVVEGPRPRHQVRSVVHLLRHGWFRPVCSRTLSPSTAVASVYF